MNDCTGSTTHHAGHLREGTRVSITHPATGEGLFGVVTRLTEDQVTVKVSNSRFFTTSVLNPGIRLQTEV